ncbi:MAG: hypothetical protein AAF657_25215 [Acidobacteriota bacterium]
MRGLAAVLRYETLLQLRTTRFRLAAVLYGVVCAVPALLLLLVFRTQANETLGATSYLVHTLAVQPFLTVLLAALVAGNRSSAEALYDGWPVLAAASTSNTGYVVRRWLALLVLIVPLTILPQLTTLAISYAAGIRTFELSVWIGSWVLWILPLALAISAYWLGLVMICGSELGALMLSILGIPIVRSLVNDAMLRLDVRMTFRGIADWLGLENLGYWFQVTSAILRQRGEGRQRFHPGYAATEAPSDLIQVIEWQLPRATQAAGAAALMLCLAVAFARRTRRDLKPRPVRPNHPVRTFLEMLNRQRQVYAPDGGLGRREHAMMALGVLLFVGSMLFVLGLQHHYQGLAGQRYQAEMHDDYEPLPKSLETLAWSLRSRLEGLGRVRTELSGQMVNRGTELHDQLAFTLNPGLQVEAFEVPGHTVTTERSWDRLKVILDPPLAPGETLDLESRLSGVPRRIDFFPRRGDYPFVMRYERLQATHLMSQIQDLSRMPVERAVTARRVGLRTTDLAPMPRYTPWTLTRPGEGDGDWTSEGSDFGREVPRELVASEVELTVDVEAPKGRFLADTCGHFSRVNGARVHLRGACRTALKDYKVIGGPLVVTRETSASGAAADQVTFAALPAHREQAETYRKSLALVAALSDKAWPGMPGIDGVVAVELPPEPHYNLRRGMGTWDEVRAELQGQLLVIPERLLISRQPPQPEDMVAQFLGRDLRARRPVAEGQETLFDAFFRALMLRRMGLAQKGAAVSGPGWMPAGLKRAILASQPFHRFIWSHRLPAVLVEVESRVGSDNFYSAIESFLAASSGEPGTIQELFRRLEERSGVSLTRIYEDHFEGNALPMLRLVDARSERWEGQWRVVATLRNTGTGEAVCPVVVKTDVSERVIRVTVDSESDSAFTVSVTTRPHTLLLDPEDTCYRWKTPASQALERINLLQ